MLLADGKSPTTSVPSALTWTSTPLLWNSAGAEARYGTAAPLANPWLLMVIALEATLDGANVLSVAVAAALVVKSLIVKSSILRTKKVLVWLSEALMKAWLWASYLTA